MNELISWIKKIIAGLARFLASIFSSIANAIEPNYLPKELPSDWQQFKSAVVSVNREGRLTIRKVNDTEILKKGRLDIQTNSAETGAEGQPVLAKIASGTENTCCGIIWIDGVPYYGPVPC
jgi:hypothetical protein